ncbi:MAG TPA: hypothetical protein VE907_23320 [Gammaproteobacteria bacterium]|nr:hypothetical protein [Gammaproteobacteria bacterium]
MTERTFIGAAKRLGFIGVLALLAFSTFAQPSATELAGDWQGALDANGTQLRLVFHVSVTTDGKLAATLDSLDQGAKGIPVQSVTMDGSSVRFDVSVVAGVYEAKLADKNTMTGKWRQSGMELPLDLKRE